MNRLESPSGRKTLHHGPPKSKLTFIFPFQCQYIFVHDALQHYIESGFKLDIAADDLKDHLQILRKNLSSQSRLDLELEVCQD